MSESSSSKFGPIKVIVAGPIGPSGKTVVQRIIKESLEASGYQVTTKDHGRHNILGGNLTAPLLPCEVEIDTANFVQPPPFQPRGKNPVAPVVFAPWPFKDI